MPNWTPENFERGNIRVYWDHGKENGNYYNMLDNGKEKWKLV